MKTVFDSDMLAHVWAQRRQPYGKTSNGNFYFNAGIDAAKVVNGGAS